MTGGASLYVLLNGTTEFPEPIALAATFDTPRIHEMAVAISTEGRIKHAQAARAGHSNIFEGLDFWAPNINILPPSPMGPRSRNLWGGSLPYSPYGRGIL